VQLQQQIHGVSFFLEMRCLLRGVHSSILRESGEQVEDFAELLAQSPQLVFAAVPAVYGREKR
jgi:hypothetical protein